MKRLRKYQRQSRVGYRRSTMNTVVIHETEDKIRKTCRQFNVSRSFVIAVALAAFFNVNKQESYDE